jgi:hypothetical protein
VAGAALLVLAANPYYLGGDVAARLVGTARDTGLPGRDDVYGAGLLDVAAAVGPAAVQAARPPKAGDAYEPDDTVAGARAIPLSGSLSATIAPEGEIDWYRITVPPATRVGLYLAPPPCCGLTTALDPMLRVRQGGVVVADVDWGSTGDPESFTFGSASGGD